MSTSRYFFLTLPEVVVDDILKKNHHPFVQRLVAISSLTMNDIIKDHSKWIDDHLEEIASIYKEYMERAIRLLDEDPSHLIHIHHEKVKTGWRRVREYREKHLPFILMKKKVSILKKEVMLPFQRAKKLFEETPRNIFDASPDSSEDEAESQDEETLVAKIMEEFSPKMKKMERLGKVLPKEEVKQTEFFSPLNHFLNLLPKIPMVSLPSDGKYPDELMSETSVDGSEADDELMLSEHGDVYPPGPSEIQPGQHTLGDLVHPGSPIIRDEHPISEERQMNQEPTVGMLGQEEGAAQELPIATDQPQENPKEKKRRLTKKELFNKELVGYSKKEVTPKKYVPAPAISSLFDPLDEDEVLPDMTTGGPDERVEGELLELTISGRDARMEEVLPDMTTLGLDKIMEEVRPDVSIAGLDERMDEVLPDMTTGGPDERVDEDAAVLPQVEDEEREMQEARQFRREKRAQMKTITDQFYKDVEVIMTKPVDKWLYLPLHKEFHQAAEVYCENEISDMRRMTAKAKEIVDLFESRYEDLYFRDVCPEGTPNDMENYILKCFHNLACKKEVVLINQHDRAQLKIETPDQYAITQRVNAYHNRSN